MQRNDAFESLRGILGKTFPCECGKTHRMPLREVVYAEDGLDRVPGLASHASAGGRVAVVLSDSRTRQIAGRTVEDGLGSAGWQVRPVQLPDGPKGGDPVCDEATRDWAKAAGRLPCDAIVAAGSGVVSDIAKWISAETRIPYIMVATAASMNGYASANVAPTIGGIKRLFPGTVPNAIVGVPSILRDAPARLTAAGLGDVLAKPVSVTDWRMNRILFGEHYCERSAEIIRDVEPLYRDRPEELRRREPAAIEALFFALCGSGISMTLVGTSAPASGGEHLISHTLDMTAEPEGTAHDYHGRQVGVATVFAAALYERILGLEDPEFCAAGDDTDRAYWKMLTGAVEEENARKREKARRAAGRLKEPGVWDAVRSEAARAGMSAVRIKDCLRQAGAAHRIADIGCSRRRFVEAVRHSHQIRERFTVLDLARSAGILPGAVEAIVEEYLLE